MMRKMENQSKIRDELRTDARRHDPTNGGRNTCTWAESRLAYRPSMPYGYATFRVRYIRAATSARFDDEDARTADSVWHRPHQINPAGPSTWSWVGVSPTVARATRSELLCEPRSVGVDAERCSWIFC